MAASDAKSSALILSSTPEEQRTAQAGAGGWWANEKKALSNIFCSPLMLLMAFVPLGIMAPGLGLNDCFVFCFNFFAIVPLAGVLGASTESLAVHTGQMIGGLLNATFGNAVEMIMCIQAVKAGLIQVVQGNLLGSVLSNMLLVLGMAIFAAGTKYQNQKFNAEGAAANMTCQIVASISVCFPTLYAGVAGTHTAGILMISRISAMALSIVYFMFLYFQLITHASLFVDDAEGEEAEEEEVSLSLAGSCSLLICCTLIVAACSEGLVDSIEGVSENFGLPKAFIGVILLPIVGNAAEHATAVTSAYKGKLDLAIGVAVGSSTQIALFVVPVAVLAGWAYDTPMSLNFRMFDTACQMLSVFLVSQVLQHGYTNWLHGAMLMTTYFLIAIMSWFIPEST